ncbi:MAG: lysylphosphatidylglycerol synthase domain-containing protein [Vicinamibacterales bacterium]
MARPVPQIISLVAVLLGTALFAATLLFIDREETLETLARLGLALPLVLAPSVCWHLFRTLGWYLSFPTTGRPGFWRVFRVRLAADAVAYFTIRGVASEPLRVVLLLDRVPATVSAAATVLERTMMGILSAVLVGACAAVAMHSDLLPDGWQRVFRGIAIAAVVLLALSLLLVLRSGRYLGPLFERVHRHTGWRWASGRAVRFVSEVEAIVLHLVRADWRRLRLLTLLAVACFGLMALEVWLVFWAIGQSISLWASAIIETFTRSASIFGGAIPANLGALEAANVMVVKALGLSGAGSLALARRVRSLIWAGLGLALYPRDTWRAPKEQHP